MSGVVFHHISEGIMAQDLKLSVADARDSLSVLLPDVKNGNIIAADYVLSRLGVKTNENWSGSYANGNPIWGTTSHQNNQVKLTKVENVQAGLMPDVTDASHIRHGGPRCCLSAGEQGGKGADRRTRQGSKPESASRSSNQKRRSVFIKTQLI